MEQVTWLNIFNCRHYIILHYACQRRELLISEHVFRKEHPFFQYVGISPS